MPISEVGKYFDIMLLIVSFIAIVSAAFISSLYDRDIFIPSKATVVLSLCGSISLIVFSIRQMDKLDIVAVLLNVIFLFIGVARLYLYFKNKQNKS